MGILLACASVHHVHTVLSEARRGNQDSLALKLQKLMSTSVYWELNLDL